MTRPHRGAAFSELTDTRTFLVIDIETTRVRDAGDKYAPVRPVSIACVVAKNARIVETRHWLVDPGVPIDKDSSDHHHITDEDIAHGKANRVQQPEDAIDQLVALIDSHPGAYLVCHKAGFDIGALRAEAERVGSLFVTRWVLDTMTMGRRLDIEGIPAQPSLASLVEHYEVVVRAKTRLRLAEHHAEQTAHVLYNLLADAANKGLVDWDGLIGILNPLDTLTVKASFPGRKSRATRAIVPATHYQLAHGTKLPGKPSPAAVQAWVAQVSSCVDLGCAHIAEKVQLEASRAPVLFEHLLGLMEFAKAEPGRMGTLLGALTPMLDHLNRSTVTEAYKKHARNIKVAPHCTDDVACPSCAAGLPCPQDVFHQAVARRYAATFSSLTGSQAAESIYRSGPLPVFSKWPKKGYDELIGHVMWLAIKAFQAKGDVRMARQLLGRSVRKNLHLAEPRLALEQAREWAFHHRTDDIAELVREVMTMATTDPAYNELEVWQRDTYLPSARPKAAKRAHKPKSELKRRPSPIEYRPPGLRHSYRYAVLTAAATDSADSQ
jgi:DNA polymerase III epsilon subunit-like protein